jgi:hypothetical protein
MKRSTTQDSKEEILLKCDPVVPCEWLPDHEVKLSEYMKMITYFVQKNSKENWNAKPIHIKKSTD